jgi:hypothetical protein
MSVLPVFRREFGERSTVLGTVLNDACDAIDAPSTEETSPPRNGRLKATPMGSPHVLESSPCKYRLRFCVGSRIGGLAT